MEVGSQLEHDQKSGTVTVIHQRPGVCTFLMETGISCAFRPLKSRRVKTHKWCTKYVQEQERRIYLHKYELRK